MFAITSQVYDLERQGVILHNGHRINIYRVENIQEKKLVRDGMFIPSLWEVYRFIESFGGHNAENKYDN